MATLSYRSAVKIAAREMQASRGKFFFVVLSVAIGVAALTGGARLLEFVSGYAADACAVDPCGGLVGARGKTADAGRGGWTGDD